MQIRENAHRAELEKVHLLHRQEIDTLTAERDALQQRCDQLESAPPIAGQPQVGTNSSETEERSEPFAHLSPQLAQASSQVSTLREGLVLARQGLAASRDKDRRIARLYEELASVRMARNALIEKLATSDELSRNQLQRAEQRSKQRENESRQVLAQYLSIIEQLQYQLNVATQQSGPEDQQKPKRQEAELRALLCELSDAKAAVTLAERQMGLLITLVQVSAEGRELTNQAAAFGQRQDVVELLDRLKGHQQELGRQVAEAAHTHRYDPQPHTRELLLEHIWGKLVVSSPRLSEEWLAAALIGPQTSAARKPEL